MRWMSTEANVKVKIYIAKNHIYLQYQKKPGVSTWPSFIYEKLAEFTTPTQLYF